MIPIPDHPIGERFCRKCGLFLPLKDFFKGKKRRFQCKVHSQGRPRRAPAKKQKLPSSEKTSKTSPQKKNTTIAQVWHAAYTDCRSSFGQATVGLSQSELRDLFEALGAEPSTAVRLVPIDPCKELTTGNARLVRREVRIRALRAWWDAKKRHSGKEGSNARDSYMAALQNAAAADGVVEGPCQPGGLVRTEDSSERQSGDLVGDAKEEYVEDGEGTDDECNDDDDNDDAQHQAVRLEIE